MRPTVVHLNWRLAIKSINNYEMMPFGESESSYIFLIISILLLLFEMRLMLPRLMCSMSQSPSVPKKPGPPVLSSDPNMLTWTSCLCLPSAGVTGICHHMWLCHYVSILRAVTAVLHSLGQLTTSIQRPTVILNSCAVLGK